LTTIRNIEDRKTPAAIINNPYTPPISSNRFPNENEIDCLYLRV